MKTEFIEASLYRWFSEELSLPEEFADAVYLHKPWVAFPERTELWVYPRITGFARQGISRRGAEFDFMTLVVGCHVKNPPGGREVPQELSRLVDAVRSICDSTERAGAYKVHDVANRIFAVGDFGPAQEVRSYNESVSIGGITIPGVDSAVLTVQVTLSPVKPRVQPLVKGANGGES